MNTQFGSGVLYGVPNAGNLASNPSPRKFGVLQSVSIEFKADLKKLFGQSQFPVAKARGKIEVTGKATLAIMDPGFLKDLYFGQNSVSGITQMAVDEAAAIPASPFQITVAQAATFVTDFGVIDTATGVQMEKVASAPATGQYSVNAATGVYTFAAADTLKAVKISYTYTTASQGSTVTLNNQLMGYAPEFRMFLWNTFRGKRLGLELYSCTLGQLTIPTKQDDFWIMDISFDAGVDATDTLGKLYADN
jgi:hypothetical protein